MTTTENLKIGKTKGPQENSESGKMFENGTQNYAF